MRWLPLCLAVIVSGCSGGDSIDTTFDPCSPLTVVTDSEAPVEILGVEEAVSVWGQVLPTEIEIVTSATVAASLRIEFTPGDSFYRALYVDSLGEIWIGAEQLDPEVYGIALAHEMGHAFGLLHVSKEARASVMNVGNTDVPPTPEDADALRALWPACDRPLTNL